MPAGMTSGSADCWPSCDGGQRAGGRDAGARLVAEQRHQVGDAAGLRGGAQVALVRVALVVEGEDVGEVGPPLEHLQAEVARRRPPAARWLLAGQRPQQGPAEAGEVVGPVGDGRQARRVADDLRVLGAGAGARTVPGLMSLPPPAPAASPPRACSGRCRPAGSGRRDPEPVSGSGAQSGWTPRLRYWTWSTPSTPRARLDGGQQRARLERLAEAPLRVVEEPGRAAGERCRAAGAPARPPRRRSPKYPAGA